MKRFLSHCLCLACLGLFFSGCTTRYYVKLDALSSGEGSGSGGGVTYRLASATPGVEDSDLFFKEVARYVSPVLAEQGFRPAGKGGDPELEIRMDAHLSDPMVETRTYSDPVYVEYGGHMRYMRVPVLNKEGKVVSFNYSRYYVPGHTRLGGWVERDRQVTVFDKVLKLSARRILNDGSLSDELWAITVSMRDGSTDYRSALPYMVVAARPYIGKRTEGEQVITLLEDDPQVLNYRSSLSDGR